ncbi:uncharacterized protein LOC133744916 [Rosa rugosa]|uniref:uncharacterized protein LOC133744916 n=1 Tax=Rosa rugosa TaxID=74645 RepID=UPI002B40A0CE|nr:uncharacterized protein LOC133744916 [Rosa rugosa]
MKGRHPNPADNIVLTSPLNCNGFDGPNLPFVTYYLQLAGIRLRLQIFNLVAVNIDNETVREALAVTSVILCVFGLLYGGFWRIQMRKRFNLPSYNFCFGEPTMYDCTLWLFCCWCSLAHEMRIGYTYDIVEDQFCRKEIDILSQPPMSPLPREDGVGQLRFGPSSHLGNYSIPTKTGIIGSPSPSRFSKELYNPDRALSSVKEESHPTGKDKTMTALAPSLIRREAT